LRHSLHPPLARDARPAIATTMSAFTNFRKRDFDAVARRGRATDARHDDDGAQWCLWSLFARLCESVRQLATIAKKGLSWDDSTGR
jgi:hypothetical protein